MFFTHALFVPCCCSSSHRQTCEFIVLYDHVLVLPGYYVICLFSLLACCAGSLDATGSPATLALLSSPPRLPAPSFCDVMSLFPFGDLFAVIIHYRLFFVCFVIYFLDSICTICAVLWPLLLDCFTQSFLPSFLCLFVTYLFYRSSHHRMDVTRIIILVGLLNETCIHTVMCFFWFRWRMLLTGLQQVWFVSVQRCFI